MFFCFFFFFVFFFFGGGGGGGERAWSKEKIIFSERSVLYSGGCLCCISAL